MESMKYIWNRMVAPPRSAELRRDQLERWTLRNAVHLLGAVCSFFGVLAFMAFGLMELHLAAFAVWVGFLLGYLLSRRGHRRTAGVVAIIPLDLALVINSQNFGSGLFESAVLVYICLAFLLFEPSDLVFLVGVVVVSVAAAALAAVPLLPEPPITVPESQRIALRVITLVLVAIQLTVVMLYFMISRHRAVARLHVALEHSEVTSDAKSHFLAHMSHEIRTPLNGVLGMLSVLEDTELSRTQQSFLDTARTSGQVLLDIINDILDLAKVEAGELVLEPGIFDLRALVEDTARQAAVQTRGRALQVIARYPPGAPASVIGDAGRVRQVLINLLGNAVKFTTEGHIVIAVDYQPDHDQGGFLFTVTDTGIGIPDSAHAVIFEKFKQVDSSITRKQGGTGLGLAIVKELVTRMNGHVGVRSEPDAGTTFWVRLPLPIAPDEPEHATPDEPEHAAPDGMRALVADAHPLCGQALSEQLEHWGMQVVTCATAEATRETLHQAASAGAPFDMAFISNDMPGGHELAAAAAGDAELGRPRVILVAPMAESVDQTLITALGGTGHVRKPIQQAELRDAIAASPPRSANRDGHDQPGHRPGPGLVTSDSARLEQHRRLTRIRVLVVEDNAINQKVATRMLMNLGCSADVAANGREAIELLAEVPYDLVFMDVQMPEMDGLEATAAIRARETTSGGHVPIIAMTAHAMAGDRQRCLAAGMDGYVSKPIRPAELATVLTRHLHSPPQS